MAYIYQVAFALRPEQTDQLEIGAPLERSLGYLRARLPGEPGFVTARAMRSIVRGDVRIVLETVWEEWDDIVRHAASPMAEDKILEEFEPHVRPDQLDVRLYEEVD